MNRRPSKNRGHVFRNFILLVVFAVFLASCSKGATPTPTLTFTPPGTWTPVSSWTPVPAATPTPSPTSTPTPVSPPTPTPTLKPGETPRATPTPTATPVPLESLDLRVLSPQDGAGVEIGAVRVLGAVRPDAAVAVNGTPVDVAVDGIFQHDVTLREGVNGIEVVATDLFGHVESDYIAVFFISPTAGLPFSLFYPFDGLQVSEPTVHVVGGTRQDAVVGVNGTPVEVNTQGIFATTVSLEEGVNLIEVVAADVASNVRFQTVSVFYVP